MSRSTLALALLIALFALAAIVLTCCRRGVDSRVRRDLWRVYASTAAIVAVVLVPAALHPLFFSAVLAAGAYRCVVELALSHGERASASLHCAAAVVATAAVFAGSRVDAHWAAAWTAASAAALVIGPAALVRRLDPRVRWLAAASFPLAGAAHLARIIHLPDGFFWVFLAYACAETHDSVASLVGRLFGRRPLLPQLSPRKTREGAAAGAVAGVAVAAAIAGALLDEPARVALALAVLLTAAAIGGDLYTSGVKRAAGIKDFPAVHRLHGGVLDIYDSTLAAGVALSIALWIMQGA